MIGEIFTVVTPVFLIAAIGYLWVRRQQPFDNNTVSTLVMYVGSPCLVYTALTTNTPDLTLLGQMAVAAALVIGLGLVFGALLLKALGWPIRTYLPALIHPNCGNMGLPLVLLAFGDIGLALGVAYFFVNSISQYSLGLSIAAGHFDLQQLLRQPIIWAVGVVLFVLFSGVAMPRWFDATASILGGLTIPAMLLMLGTSLARLSVASVKQTLSIALARLSLGVGLGLLVIWLLDLDGVGAGVVLLQSSMPSAVFNYIFADRFGDESDKVAAVILQSTLVSVVTLPFLVGWALAL
jgi:predicted permease